MNNMSNSSTPVMSTSITDRWPYVIGGIGILLGIVLGAEIIAVTVFGQHEPGGYIAGVVTSIPLIAWLLYGAYDLTHTDISPDRFDRVGGWCLIGMVGFSAFITVVSVASQSLSTLGIVSTARWAATVGAALGFGVGLFDARAMERTFEAGRAWARQEETMRERDRLEEFAQIVSHDLRNPHTVAVGRLELAQDECDSDHLADVETALQRMEAIIEDTLTLAREGQTVGETEPVDLADIVKECWGMVQTGQANIEIESTMLMEADRDRLNHVFENLMRNAIEHAGPDVTIRVGRLADENGFYVADDGPGIAAEVRDSLFEPGEKGGIGGSGFGLAIVNRTVEAHGWDIRVTESDTGGARFEITGVERVDG